jgi:hypothetical protein
MDWLCRVTAAAAAAVGVASMAVQQILMGHSTGATELGQQRRARVGRGQGERGGRRGLLQSKGARRTASPGACLGAGLGAHCREDVFVHRLDLQERSGSRAQANQVLLAAAATGANHTTQPLLLPLSLLVLPVGVMVQASLRRLGAAWHDSRCLSAAAWITVALGVLRHQCPYGVAHQLLLGMAEQKAPASVSCLLWAVPGSHHPTPACCQRSCRSSVPCRTCFLSMSTNLSRSPRDASAGIREEFTRCCVSSTHPQGAAARDCSGTGCLPLADSPLLQKHAHHLGISG